MKERIIVKENDINLKVTEVNLTRNLNNDYNNLINKPDIGTLSNIKTFICGETGGIGGHRVVYLDENGYIKYANNNDLNSVKKIVGITTQASSYLAVQNVQTYGELTDSSFNFNVNYPIYLNGNGLISQTYPSNTCIILGFVVSLNKIFINIQQPIILGS
jgi:CheY-specific phosphatase CheX